MRLGTALLLSLAILILSPALADNLTCQYRDIQNVSNSTIVFYYENVSLDSPILTVNDTKYFGNTNDSLTRWTYEFKVYSRYGTYIYVTVSYLVDGKKNSMDLVIPPHQYEIVFGRGKGGVGLNFNSINFNITYPAGITAKRENMTRVAEVCRKCLGKICLNDGQACSRSGDCGGGFCVRGFCSNNKDCYNNDCNCSAAEIQCTDNKTCVRRSSVALGAATKCNMSEECNTSYVDAATGRCAKTPEQIRIEEEQTQPLGQKILKSLTEDPKTREETTRFLTILGAGVALIVLFIVLRGRLKGRPKESAPKTLQKGTYRIKAAEVPLEKKKDEEKK